MLEVKLTQVAKSTPFDTTPNGFPSSAIMVQDALELMAVRHQATVQATINGTTTFNLTTVPTTILTGTTAGQIINLGDATTYQIGRRYELMNVSTQNITIKDFGSTLVSTLVPNERIWLTLQSNSTQPGVWLFLADAVTVGGGSKGTIGSLAFAQPGIGSGTYLRIGGNASNFVGYLIPGSTSIVGVAFSCQNAMSGATVIQIQNRSAVSTLADIAGASLTVPNGQYKATVNLAVSLAAGSELAAYIKSGSTPGFSVFTIFCAP